jgi:GT2 family glycosyltransferase
MRTDGPEISPALQVSAVLVHFRTPERLRESLDSLRAQTRSVDEIVVVDNSARVDGVGERPAPGNDWRWIPAPGNLGYAAACNLGAHETQGDLLLFLNPDVTLAPEACARLMACTARDPGAAVVGPRIYTESGDVELSARAFPSIVTGLAGRTSVVTRALRQIGIVPNTMFKALDLRGGQVDWVSGACMLVRRDAFSAVGGFDEGYWMYWEDADLCRRLRGEGWTVCFEPGATARHVTGSSGETPATLRAFHDSAARYYAKHLARSRTTASLVRAILRARSAVALFWRSGGLTSFRSGSSQRGGMPSP